MSSKKENMQTTKFADHTSKSELDENVYLSMYQNNMEYSRFHENLREASTKIILLVAGGLFALVTGKFAAGDYNLHISLAIIGLGFFGAILSAAHSLKQSEHYDQATVFYDSLLNANSKRQLVKQAAKKAKLNARLAWFGYRPRLGTLWFCINVLIIIGGFSVLYLSTSQYLI